MVLVCTWGAQGAAAVKLHDSPAQYEWARVADTWRPPEDPQAKVVDTIGAGDTFIAGMLYQLATYPEIPLSDKVRYAVQLASRKVHQDGFGGLGKAMYPPPS
jgi:ketohexokinase